MGGEHQRDAGRAPSMEEPDEVVGVESAELVDSEQAASWGPSDLSEVVGAPPQLRLKGPIRVRDGLKPLCFQVPNAAPPRSNGRPSSSSSRSPSRASSPSAPRSTAVPSAASWPTRSPARSAPIAPKAGDPELVAAYGASDAELVRRYAPNLAYEPGERSLPIDWRDCRIRACSRAPDKAGLDAHISDAGNRATAFTHVVRSGGETFIQYWLYYPYSNTTIGNTREGVGATKIPLDQIESVAGKVTDLAGVADRGQVAVEPDRQGDEGWPSRSRRTAPTSWPSSRSSGATCRSRQGARVAVLRRQARALRSSTTMIGRATRCAWMRPAGHGARHVPWPLPVVQVGQLP